MSAQRAATEILIEFQAALEKALSIEVREVNDGAGHSQHDTAGLILLQEDVDFGRAFFQPPSATVVFRFERMPVHVQFPSFVVVRKHSDNALDGTFGWCSCAEKTHI